MHTCDDALVLTLKSELTCMGKSHEETIGEISRSKRAIGAICKGLKRKRIENREKDFLYLAIQASNRGFLPGSAFE